MIYEEMALKLINTLLEKYKGNKAAVFAEVQEKKRFFDTHTINKSNVDKSIKYDIAYEYITELILKDFMLNNSYSLTKKGTWKKEEA